jgi:hypothetical protein
LVEKGTPISDENDAFFEYGKKVLVEPVEIIKDFIKLMIPITTGVIPTYFALLEFSGTEPTNTIKGPFLLLLSLLVFIVTSFPLPAKLTLSNIDSIKRYRTRAMTWKYIGCCIGCGLFLSGFFVMILDLTRGI